MLALVATKAFSLLFHGIDYHFIKTTGAPVHGWAITYYAVHIAKGALLFISIMLIGAGFGFIKHALNTNERKVLMFILSLQIISGVADSVFEEADEGSEEKEVFHSLALLVDLLCCAAVLFPVVWSIRHLRESAMTDGKAASSIVKLKLFRKFYIMVLAYIYATRLLVWLIDSSVPFRYEWLGAFVSEMIALAFYAITAVMFSPEPDNEYLQVPTEEAEEEIMMDEVFFFPWVGQIRVLKVVVQGCPFDLLSPI